MSVAVIRDPYDAGIIVQRDVETFRIKYLRNQQDVSEGQLLADPEPVVRTAAAKVLAAAELPAGAAPLRLKVLLGDTEPNVTQECPYTVPMTN